jgi:hypothetical protein
MSRSDTLTNWAGEGVTLPFPPDISLFFCLQYKLLWVIGCWSTQVESVELTDGSDGLKERGKK